MFSTRSAFLVGFIVCAAAMGIALYSQHIIGLEPCPLCIFQRISVIVLGVIFLIAALHNPQTVGKRIYGFLLTVTTAVGISIAGRHLWLQYGPHDELGCGPGLDYMMDVMPLDEVISSVFKGTGDCGEIVWSLFGISIPGWTLMFFILVLIFSLKTLFSKSQEIEYNRIR